METPYSKAWHKFVNSPEGKVCVQRAAYGYATGGDDLKHAENRVREAFDAGWNAAQEAQVKRQ